MLRYVWKLMMFKTYSNLPYSIFNKKQLNLKKKTIFFWIFTNSKGSVKLLELIYILFVTFISTTEQKMHPCDGMSLHLSAVSLDKNPTSVLAPEQGPSYITVPERDKTLYSARTGTELDSIKYPYWEERWRVIGSTQSQPHIVECLLRRYAVILVLPFMAV